MVSISVLEILIKIASNFRKQKPKHVATRLLCSQIVLVWDGLQRETKVMLTPDRRSWVLLWKNGDVELWGLPEV